MTCLLGRVALALLLAISTATLSRAATPASGWQLDGWVDHYPGEPLARGGPTLWRVPAVAHALDAMLPPPERRLLAAMRVEQPVQRIDAYLLARVCMPHECGAQTGMVVFDPRGERVWIALYTRLADKIASRWFGATDPSALPPEIRAAIDAQHQP